MFIVEVLVVLSVSITSVSPQPPPTKLFRAYVRTRKAIYMFLELGVLPKTSNKTTMKKTTLPGKAELVNIRDPHWSMSQDGKQRKRSVWS